MKHIQRTFLLILIIISINSNGQKVVADTTQIGNSLKHRLKKINYQNITSKWITQSLESQTAKAALAPSDGYNLEELNTLTSSPEGNDLFRIAKLESDLYTGAQNIKIPLFTIEEGNIILPITLVYHTTGIKVDQRSSEVGLGWSLVTGPQINRKINIVNDWYQTNTYMPWPKPNGYFRKIREQLPVVNNLNYYQAESTPDEYLVALQGKMRKFIFTDENTPLELTKSNLQIQAQSSAFTNFSVFQPKDFSQFKILDNDGIRYTFNDAGFRTVSVESMELTNQTSSYTTEGPAVSEWKISKIEDMLNNSLINFDYFTSTAMKFKTSVSENSTRRCPSSTYNNANHVRERCVSSGLPSDFLFYVNHASDGTAAKKYVSKIEFSSGKLLFNYDEIPVNSQYTGLPDPALSEIILKDIELRDKQNILLKKYTFSYDKFNCTTNTNDIYPCEQRLKLVSVNESGKGSYEFSYNNLPLYSYTTTKFDFLGYHTDAQIDDIEKGLYYYPNMKEWSLLPYNVPVPAFDPSVQTNMRKIKLFNHDQASQYKLKVLPFSTYARAGILETVKFPTGGEQRFEYEPNDFILFDSHEVQGAGLRIKETYLQEGSTPQRRVRYEYKNPLTNKSSGLLLAPPYIGYPFEEVDTNFPYSEIMNEQDVMYAISFNLYNKTNSNADIINGSTVGYGRVVKKYDDGSSEEYIFKNKNNDYELQDLNYSYNSIFPGASTDFTYGQFKNLNSAVLLKYKNFDSYGNGNIIEKNVFGKNGIISSKTANIYRNNAFEPLTATFPYYTFFSNITNNWSPWTYGTYRIKYTSYFNDIISTTKTDYFSNGQKSETTNYTYIDVHSNVLRTTEKSNGVKIERKFLRDDLSLLGIPEFNLLTQYNNINALSSEKKVLNGRTINSSNLKYDNFILGSTVVPKVAEIQQETLNGLPDNTFKILSYNSKGKVVESTSNAIPNVTIWGYNDNLPVAKIVGATYADVAAYITPIVTASNLDIDSVSEQNLMDALQTFRINPNLSKFQITTYTYDPLIGVTSVTLPSGLKETFIYNSNNFLEKVVDQSGNIVRSYKYNIN